MTKNQPVNVYLFRVGADLDDIEAQFERVRNSLFFFNEILDEAVDSMRDSDDCYVMNLIQRYDMLSSIMELATMQLGNGIEALNSKAKAICQAAHDSEKGVQSDE